METEEIFGPEKTWDDLRRVLASYLWKRFWDISPDDVDDACGVAMVDLVDYWMTLPSSVTPDLRRNWAFALWRAKHVGAKFLHRLLKERSQVWSYDSVDRDYTGDGYSPASLETWIAGVSDPEPLDDDEARDKKIREILGELPEEELQAWLYPVLVGESERGQARRTNTYRSAVRRTRIQGQERLWTRITEMGIYQ